MSNAKRNAAIALKHATLANQLFGELNQEKFWNRKTHKGFLTVPRTMPFLIQLIDGMTKGKPAGNTYFVLWCHSMDHPMVEIKNEKDFALESGFSGERAANTWRYRMKRLKELEFIEARAAAHEYSYILLPNPHSVVMQHVKSGTLKGNNIVAALLKRASEIGAQTDFEVS